MPDIRLNEREQSALMGLPYMLIVLYLYLRRHMDYGTGITGLVRGISHQSISEALYIEPHPGIKSGSPHRSAIRRALDTLVRAGLLDRTGGLDNLVFSLPFAFTDKTAPKKADTKPTPKADTVKPAPVLKRSQQADMGKTAQGDIPPVSGISILSPPPVLELSNTAGGVEFHQIIKPENRPAIEVHIQQAKPETRQQIIDELIAYMSKQSGQGKPVQNPAAVVRRMVEREKQGEFVAEQSHIGRKMRQQEAARLAPPAPKPQQEPKLRSKPPVNLRDILKGNT